LWLYTRERNVHLRIQEIITLDRSNCKWNFHRKQHENITKYKIKDVGITFQNYVCNKFKDDIK